MPVLRSNIARFLIIITLLLLLTLPQLNNVHYDPAPQFWAEITVAYLVVILFTIVLFTTKRLTIPSCVIPLGLFALLLLFQPLLVKVDFIGLSLITVIEFILCILAAIAINSIINEYGIKQFMIYLCYSLLVGAILQSCIGLIQYNNWISYFHGYIFYDSSHPNTNIFGHFGQRNHYAHYLSWSIFALIYLTCIRKIPTYLYVGLLSWLIFSITIASSRSVFIYFGVASLISFIYWLNKRQDKQIRLVFLLVLSASIYLVAFEYIYPLLQSLIHTAQISSGLERISNDSGAGRRLVEWEKAWMVFKHHPLWGDGWNEYAKQSVLLHHLFPHAPLNDGLFTNSHNLIMQLLAETGIIGTIIIVSGLAASIWRIIKNSSLETIIILCMIGTTLSHSMLEYPLWYLYFLIPLVMFLAIEKPIFQFKIRTFKYILLLPLIWFIYFFINSSLIFDHLVDISDTPDDAPSFVAQAHYLQNMADSNVLWSYYALYTLDNYINVNSINTNKVFPTELQLAYENRFESFHPYPENLIKVSMLEWNLGQKKQARETVLTALNAYPVYKQSFLNTLNNKHYYELYKIMLHAGS